jgi:phosphatidate cytidylyltransferase
LKRLKGEGAWRPKNADLKARTLSAIVMVAVAGSALWLGGLPWMVFVLLVATGVLWEWSKLSRAIAASWWARLIWLIAGVVYVGVAAEMLITLRALYNHPIVIVMLFVGAVIATDIGAYFAGRAFGGPKIAPKISPSKTWSGLFGGILGATLVFYVLLGGYKIGPVSGLMGCLQAGALIAIIAQTGDFFESWMKRRAGVKDSGHLIPGHGGLFDRVDGLLAVLFVAGVIGAVGRF